MSDQSKISRDKETGYPKYKQIEQFGEEHTHRFGGYNKKGEYYEGGHGEKIDSDSKKEAGRSFRKHRGDD